jgi:hypothetical protein
VSTLTAPPPAAAVEDDSSHRVRRERVAGSSTPRRVLAAVLALLAIYVALSFLNDPRGTLGTDTGGKLATLKAMQHNGSLNPDLGYWAQRYDPKGTLHPLYYTRQIDKKWVNATTLPMLDLGEPLYQLGGTRAVLLLPMLGSVLAALAARALARRRGGGNGWWAFWAVGLASPLAIYALDVWEHSIGIALMLWAVVLVFDVLDRRAGWRATFGAGALLGLAASMRTEALVYGLVLAAVAAIVMLHRERRLLPVVRFGALLGAGTGLLLLANQVLERVTVGGSIRAGRATDTAEAAGAGITGRVKEALTTLVGFNHWAERTDWFLGFLAVALVAYATWKLVRSGREQLLLGTVALAGAALIYVMRFAGDLGFVPGVLTASPLAVAGLVAAWPRTLLRRVLAVALGALPLVWFFQYSGGALPQWGGRYVLLTGTLLVVAAAVVLATSTGRGRLLVVALAVVVTACGVGWLAQRSHAVADGMDQIIARKDQVVVSQEAHLLREGGAFYTPQRHWLTATSPVEVRRAAHVARESGAHELALIGATGRPRPHDLDGFLRGRTQTIEFLPGFPVRVTTYRLASAAPAPTPGASA